MTGNTIMAFGALIVLILGIAAAAILYISRGRKIQAQEAEDVRAASITNTHADPITTSRATAGPDKRQQPTRAGTHTNRETDQ